MPGPRRGISPYNLASEAGDQLDTEFGVVPFRVDVSTDATGSTFYGFPSGAPFTCRVIGFEGIMTGAGSGSMSIVLKNNAGTAITNTISLAALPDQAKWDCSTVNDATWTVNKGDRLTLTTVGSALTRSSIILVRVDI